MMRRAFHIEKISAIGINLFPSATIGGHFAEKSASIPWYDHFLPYFL